ncbi:MAG: T9SS type A sorting domain-containing protein [Bacteroidales bacterium]|nr:T9SS type A sorting domain-containing protein [Bacteroidales bacterium]
MRNKFVTLLILILFSQKFYLNAQIGPGGVGNSDGTSSQPHNEVWFDASSLSFSDTDPVTDWTDVSGNDNNGTQGTAGSQPTFRTGQINSFPAVIFDGTDDFIPFDGSVLAGKDYTVIFVGQRRTSNYFKVIMGGTNTGQNNNLHLFWYNNAQFRAHHYSNDLQTNMIPNTESNSSGTDANEFGIFSTRLGSTEADPFRKNYQNNHYIPDADGSFTNSSQLNSWNGAALSRAIFGTTEYYADNDIAEVIIYSTAINAAQLEIVHNYLSEKYNITIDNDRYTAATGCIYDVAGIGMLNNDKHSRSSSAGLYLYEDNGSFDNGEFVFFSHNNATNDVASIQTGSNVTNCGAEAAWNRNWYLAKNGVISVETKLIFDFPEALTGGQYPKTPANYVLLYKAIAGADYSVVTVSAQGLEAADQVYFDVANANLNDGFYTIGTNDQTNSPVEGVSSRTWYALISGDWDNWEVWTLDPSGNLPDNPSHELPSDNSSDKVVIHSGKTVTIPAAHAKITNSSLTVDGRIDFTTNTTIHDFGEIRGNGRILLAADNFPDGDATHFFTKGQGEGTVYYYGSNYNLSTAREFYNVVVDLDVSTNIITQLANYDINGDFTVTSGIWQINDNAATTILDLDVDNDVLMESNGQITVGTGNTIGSFSIPGTMPTSGNYHKIYHQFKIGGNLTNNGTFRMTNQTDPIYNQFTSTGAVTVIFNNPANKTALLNNTSDFYNLIVDKGTDKTYILTINSSNINNFVLYGPNNVGRNESSPFSSSNPEIRKALWIHHGTLKLTGSINIPTLSEGSQVGGNGDYAIGAYASLWIAGSSVNVYSTASDNSSSGNTQVRDGSGSSVTTSTTNQAMSVYGKFRISDGFFGTRNSAGFIFWSAADAQIYIEGGLTDVAQMRGATTTGVASYVQTGGILRARGNETEAGEYAGAYPLFGLEGADAVFQMSGGEIILRDEDNDRDPEFSIESAIGNYLVTGGKITIDLKNLGTADTIQISSTANLWDLEIKNHDNAGIMTVALEHDLTVSHDLTLNAYTGLDVRNPLDGVTDHNLTIGRNFSILEDGTTKNIGIYNYRQNTTTFNGTVDGEFYIGWNHDDDYEQKLWNLTVNKTAGKQITVIGDTEKDPDNVSAEHYNRLVQVVNDANIISGILNQGRQSIRLFAGINILKNGQLGTYENGTTPRTAYIMFRDGDLTIYSDKDVTFGNIKFNSTGTVTFTSDTYIKRIGYYLGLYNIGSYNLKVDYLHRNSTTTNFSVNNGNFGKMIYSDGHASDGGLSILITENTTYSFPIGTATKYTPAEVIITDYYDDGYLTIRPVDNELKTTNLTGGDLLDYYWRVGYEGFTTNPTVQYEFKYDDSDIVGTESNYVAGKVLDGSGYIRSDEGNPPDNVDDANNTITFNNEGTGGFTLENANYTAGDPNRFIGTPDEFHANSSYVSWNTPSAWLENQVPTEGSIVYITDGRRMSGPTTDVGYQAPAETILSGTDARVQYYNSGTYDLGVVKGYGIISFKLPEDATVNGDFADFASDSRSRYLFFASNTSTYTLNHIPQPAPSISLETANWIIDQNNLVLNYDFSCGYNHSNVTVVKDVLIKRNLNISDYDRGSFRFPGSGNSVIVTVEGNVNVGDNIEVINPGSASTLEHKLIVKGNISITENNIDLFNASDRPYVILELQGETDNSYTNSAGTIIDLYRVVLNKGTSQTNKFTFSDDFNLNGPTSGSNVDKALELQNGTLILNDAAINIDLNSGDDDFKIPSTACLEVASGEVNVYGDNTGISLDGKLIVSGGTVDMVNGAGNGNNYIQYSSSGSATISVSSGYLSVGSQIRRGLNSEEGVLKWTQTGGSVVVGENSAPENTRGVFEILNTGSSFTHSGGDFTIVRAQTNPSFAAFYFDPETVNLTSGTEITIGNANTPASQNIGMYINKPLKNLVIAGSNNPVTTLWTVPITVEEDFTIGINTEFDANGLQINMQGNFINNGTYTHNNNLVLFNASTAQEIQGNSATTFYQLTKSTANTLTLQNDIQIDDDLRIEAGTLADNSNDITLLGDIYNVGTHTYGGTGDGITFAGSAQQALDGNGGVYGKLTVNNYDAYNPSGVKLTTSADEIIITNSLKLEQGLFDIGENLLTMQLGASFIEQNPFSETNMVQTNKSFTDSGIKKYFPSGTGSFIYPIGSGGKYTPINIIVSQNTSTTGYLIVKAADEFHSTITEDAEAPDDYEIVDDENVLQYYWSLKAANFTDASGTVEMYYKDEDVMITNANGSTYDVTDYITARLLSDGSGTWNKYDWDDFDEANNKLIFYFADVTENEISGDYTAGIQPNTATRKGAIPNQVPGFISVTSGDWTTTTTWQTYPALEGAGVNVPAGGPRGAIVIIDAGDDVVIDQNYITSYSTEVNGSLAQEDKFGNRLGIVTGTGTILTETGLLPAGYYEEFLSASGGTIDYTGTVDVDILNNITSLNNLRLSGTGERRMPNVDFTVLGNLIIAGSGSTLDFKNEHFQKMTVNGDIIFIGGTFTAGTGANSIVEMGGDSQQTITGNFTEANNNSAFNHFEMSNASGIILSDDIEIRNDLYFNLGSIISTTTNTITLLSSATDVVDGAGIGKFVDGPLYKYINNGSSFTFPVGDNTRYGELNITSTVTSTSPDIWEIEYYNHNPNFDGFDPALFNSPLQVVSSNEYWRIKAPANAIAKVGVRWDDNSGMTTDATNRNSMRITEWRDLGTIGVTTDDKWEEVDASNLITGTQSAGTVTQNANSTTFNEFANGNYFTLSTTYTPTTLTWDGSTSIAWNETTNWNNNIVPTSVDNIIIPNTGVTNEPTIVDGVNAVCSAMDLQSDRTLTINPTASLTLSGALTMDGDITLKSNSLGTGTLIDNGDISGGGIATVERFLTGGNFHYISAPLATVPNITFYRIMPGETGVNNNYYLYDETNTNANWAYGWTPVTSGNMTVSRGYAFYYTKDWTFNLTGGSFNTGTKTYAVTNQGSGVDSDGWNLIGNPYPSAISADEFISENSSIINGTLYFWDDDGSDGSSYQSNDYAAWNFAGSVGTAGGGGHTPNGRIAIGQSFLVRKSSSVPISQNVTFTNTMREAGETVFFKYYRIDNPQRLRLSVVSANGDLYNEALIVFLNGASDGFDNLYDGAKVEGNNDISFYSLMGDKKYAIQSFAPINWSDESSELTNRKIIPIGMNLKTGGNYSINVQNIENFESNVNMYLYDKEKAVYTYLNDIDTYSFNATCGYTNDRFEIRFESNHAPVIEANIPSQTANEDEAFNFTINESAFVEHDQGDYIVSYIAGLLDGSSLPSWLSFDETSRTFNGTATNDNVGVISIKLTVKDVLGSITSQTFTLEVLNANDAPELITEIPDQETYEGNNYSYTIPSNTFNDIDFGDELKLSAKQVNGSSLPEWLKFDYVTGRLYGTANNSNNINILITATDKSGATVSDEFILTVKSTTGIETLSESEIILYPNPTDGVFFVKTNHYSNDIDIIVMDFNGKIIRKVKPSGLKTEIDISEFASGLYFIEISNEEESKVFKINMAN